MDERPLLTALQEAFTQYHIDQEERPSPRPIGPALPALGHAISGSVGSAISRIVLYPLDLVITRLQVQHHLAQGGVENNEDEEYKDISDAVQKIYAHEGGIKAFYSGVWDDTAKGVVDSFLFFLAYNFLRESRKREKGVKKLPVLDELGVGMFAGAFSKFVTTPIQQVVTRKQTAAMVAARTRNSSASAALSTKDILLQIKDERGIQGFWSGYSASLVLTLNPALTMMLHETFVRLLIPRSKRSNPGVKTTFLLAALSKAIASTITYPFSLAKARAQMSNAVPVVSEPQMSLEKDDASSTGSKPVEKAKRNTIFNTILHIAQTEGIAALYHGLGGEVFKGFFSHGITMLVKQRVHSLIIQLYYLVLRALRRFPSPEELANMADNQLSTAKAAVSDKTTTLVANAKDTATDGATKAEELAQSGLAKSEGLLQSARHTITEGLQRTRQLAGEALEKAEKVFKDDDSVPAGDVYGKELDGDDDVLPKEED